MHPVEKKIEMVFTNYYYYINNNNYIK